MKPKNRKLGFFSNPHSQHIQIKIIKKLCVLFCSAVCLLVYQITTQPPSPPLKKSDKNLTPKKVRYSLIIVCLCVCVYFSAGLS